MDKGDILIDMIPKVIHYCWFGKNEKSQLIKDCISSWEKFCPDYKIIEWNEDNFDISQNPFTQKMYTEKKWAFVSDYVRFFILQKHGGFYLDVDVKLFKSLNELLSNEIVLSEEYDGVLNSCAFASIPNSEYINDCVKYYDDNLNDFVTSPRIMTNVYEKFPNKDKILVLKKIAFCPYSQESIINFKEDNLSNQTFGVHFWNYSWGSPLLRFLNKFAIYHSLKKLLNKLGIKNFVKRILGLART